ncbi:hypothetical protein XENORESO_012154 [Xenotaenia resolanae]|uniref:Uncharacterized protein n=1 Tax=Xenotaenia resolanae TaxID=208358 RepID=A0ABV0VSV0_9TELE
MKEEGSSSGSGPPLLGGVGLTAETTCQPPSPVALVFHSTYFRGRKSVRVSKNQETGERVEGCSERGDRTERWCKKTELCAMAELYATAEVLMPEIIQ